MTESKQTEIISRIDEAVSGRKQNKQQNKQHDYCEITAGRLIDRFTAILRLLMSKENQKPFHSENVPGILNLDHSGLTELFLSAIVANVNKVMKKQ